MNQDENIIELVPVPRGFRITRREGVRLGCFFITRLLYSFDATGKEWQEATFAAVVGLLTLPAVALDLVAIMIYYAAKVLIYVARQGFELLMYAARMVLDKGVGTLLKWLIPTIIILTLYLKWHEIKAFFDNIP